jgi:hypothetical protein
VKEKKDTAQVNQFEEEKKEHTPTKKNIRGRKRKQTTKIATRRSNWIKNLDTGDNTNNQDEFIQKISKVRRRRKYNEIEKTTKFGKIYSINISSIR